jgi:hypothetical protein
MAHEIKKLFHSKIARNITVGDAQVITPCKRSVARGKKMQLTNYELRSSSTCRVVTLNSYGVRKSCGDISSPRCATLARGYLHFTPSA